MQEAMSRYFRGCALSQLKPSAETMRFVDGLGAEPQQRPKDMVLDFSNTFLTEAHARLLFTLLKEVCECFRMSPSSTAQTTRVQLVLVKCGITNDVIPMLCSAIEASGSSTVLLTHVNLRGNLKLTSVGAKVLKRTAQKVPSLVHLDLLDCPVNVAVSNTIASICQANESGRPLTGELMATPQKLTPMRPSASSQDARPSPPARATSSAQASRTAATAAAPTLAQPAVAVYSAAAPAEPSGGGLQLLSIAAAGVGYPESYSNLEMLLPTGESGLVRRLGSAF